MSAVIDASVLVALATNDARAEAVARHLLAHRSEPLHAPHLFRYEIASGLTRAVALGALTADQVSERLERITRIRVTLHALEDVESAIEIALLLERRSAYDASYVALAQHLGTELWTIDGPLHRNAIGHGLPVRLIAT